jgi:hypothetical protein
MKDGRLRKRKKEEALIHGEQGFMNVRENLLPGVRAGAVIVPEVLCDLGEIPHKTAPFWWNSACCIPSEGCIITIL